jgi:hypothetical protein
MGIIIRKRMAADGMYSYLSDVTNPQWVVPTIPVPVYPFADGATRLQWVPSISDATVFPDDNTFTLFKQKYAADLAGADYIGGTGKAEIRLLPNRLQLWTLRGLLFSQLGV